MEDGRLPKETPEAELFDKEKVEVKKRDGFQEDGEKNWNHGENLLSIYKY